LSAGLTPKKIWRKRSDGYAMRWKVSKSRSYRKELRRLLRRTDPLGVALSRHIASLTGTEPAFEMCPGLLEA
jgi:hypothetical protein